jgi:UDP-glucose 4-epimerase
MILIVGGAGYIGSHVNKLLNQKNYKSIVFDNLIYGHKESVKWGEFVLGDTNNLDRIRETFRKYDIDAVMHLSAYAYVGESVVEPEKYYINNVVNTLNLLKVMREFDCKYFIFSSTCATYGNPEYLPLDEHHPQNPINPYGQSKLMIEKIISDYSLAYDLKYVSLRYFNAAGADTDSEIGESHDPETHLIPLALDVANGTKECLDVFGLDYKTSDGSAIRDYIHVSDIANAHILSLEYLKEGGDSNVFNLGNGDGYSVLEVIDVASRISGKQIKTKICDRREGDPERLVGDATKAKEILGWTAEIYRLEDIILSAWNWHKKKLY